MRFLTKNWLRKLVLTKLEILKKLVTTCQQIATKEPRYISEKELTRVRNWNDLGFNFKELLTIFNT